jgi:hypothetical protein
VSALWRSKEDFAKGAPPELLEMMKQYGTLEQGKWNASETFEYRFNENRDEGLFMFLARFRGGLYVSGLPPMTQRGCLPMTCRGSSRARYWVDSTIPILPRSREHEYLAGAEPVPPTVLKIKPVGCEQREVELRRQGLDRFGGWLFSGLDRERRRALPSVPAGNVGRQCQHVPAGVRQRDKRRVIARRQLAGERRACWHRLGPPCSCKSRHHVRAYRLGIALAIG